MQIHKIKATKKAIKKRIGRGGKKGTYSGRGMKGQKARSGASQSPTFEGGKTTLVQKTKKLKGFKSLNKKHLAINLDTLNKKFKDGDKVNLKTLLEKKIIRKTDKLVKILSEGNVDKKITVEGLKISKTAQEKIEKAGGKVFKIEDKKEKKSKVDKK